MNQRDIGKLVGRTSHQVGEFLTEHGYRHNGQPTKKARQEDLIDESLGDGFTQIHWDAARVVKLMEENGHELTFPLPSTLTFVPNLKGPFCIKQMANGAYTIVGHDGEIAVSVVGQKNANIVKDLLALAHKSGFRSL